MNTPDPDDIIMWPDNSWCYREELEEFGRNKSDDYRVIPIMGDRDEYIQAGGM